MSDQTPVAEPSGREFYPADLRERDWWVNWVLAVRYDEMEDGDPVDGAVATKQPVAPYKHGDAEPCRWNSGLDEDEHPTTSFSDVVDWDGMSVGMDVPAPERVLSDHLGVGIIIPVGGGDARPVTLLDWDDVRDPETGEIHPTCAWALDELDGYAEISQSGEGVHQFVFGEIPGGRRKYLRHLDDEPFVGDARPMVEMYSSGRLTAMTGRHVDGTGEDVVGGQQLIDELCYRLRNNSNNSTATPSHPFGDEADTDDAVPSTDEVADVVEADMEFVGEDPDQWDTADAPVEYAAVLRGRDRKRENELPSVANWKLIRYAALLGRDAGLSKSRVRADLADHPAWPDESDTERCRRHVESAWRAADQDRLTAPSVAKLKRLGLLPRDHVELAELRSDDHLTPAEKWAAWRDARLARDLGPDSVVPTAALEHVARDRDLYEFDALDEDADLPPKAHNAALAWVNNVWADEADVDTDEEDRATAQNYKNRHDAAVETWEDVRYLYDEDVEAGRQAARDLLESRYHFMTVSSSDTLQVYDPETGVYTDDTGFVETEIYDGLEAGSHWSTHEENEIIAGLRTRNIVDPEDLDGADLDDPHRCVANGVLNMLTGELKDHSPEYHYETRVPVKHDPEAPTEPYEEFVDDLVERDADRKALLEMVGHALMPDANQRYKKFLILTGDADNGKSQFYRRVEALLNGPEEQESNTSSVKLAKLAQNQFSMNSIHGSMANIAGEIDGKKIRKTASLKDIPGGDKVEIEPKGEDSYFAYINTTLMFSANDPPIIGERDKRAIATRIVPVELPYRFVDEPETPQEKQRVDEDELADRLETPEALSGFLNLALAGIERLEANGGDVSLPEPPKERLRQYERRADPMREFGEKCLANADGDYVVKDDVTTLYKHFAADRGYEVGSNVKGVLFDVLRGVPELNIGEGRPRGPDYTDTTLPLQGWDQRKRVLQRVTLTEEGMEYAEAAGLTVDTDDTDPEPDVLAPGDVSPDAATDSGRVPAIRGEVVADFEDKYGNAQVTLRGDDGTEIDVRAEGTDLPLVGETVRVVGARLDADDMGIVELVLRPTTEVVLERDETTSDDGPDPDQTTVDTAGTAATDGGAAGLKDHEGAQADLDHIARAMRDSAVTRPESAWGVPTVCAQAQIPDGDRVEALLKHGRERGLFGDTDEGGYYLVDQYSSPPSRPNSAHVAGGDE